MWTSGWRATEGGGGAQRGEAGEMIIFELAFEKGKYDLEKWRPRGGACQAAGIVEAKDRQRGAHALGGWTG